MYNGNYDGLTVIDRDPNNQEAAVHRSNQTSLWTVAADFYRPRATLDGNTTYPGYGNLSAWYFGDMSRSDGYGVGNLQLQGVRDYDPRAQEWSTPDAYVGDVSDPMSQQPYAWNRNNPSLYEDPSGFSPLDFPIPVPGLIWLNGHPEIVFDTPDGVYHMTKDDVDNATEWGSRLGEIGGEAAITALSEGLENPFAAIASARVFSPAGSIAGGWLMHRVAEDNVLRWNSTNTGFPISAPPSILKWFGYGLSTASTSGDALKIIASVRARGLDRIFGPSTGAEGLMAGSWGEPGANCFDCTGGYGTLQF